MKRNSASRKIAACLALVLCLGGVAQSADSSQEDMFWNSVKKSNAIDEYRVYVTQYPNGKYAGDAWRRIGQLEAQEQAQPQAKTAKKAKKKAGLATADADGLRPGSVFKDCTDCPEMVVIPAGSFEMGSPSSETGRDSAEGPQHPVRIRKPFALAKYEVTVAEFRAFVQAASYRTDAENNALGDDGCRVWGGASDGGFYGRKGFYWDNPGFAQGERHPVACISWNDAQAYVQWLSDRTGKKYRLPSESEWEYAARAGTTSSRFWGDSPDQACQYANVADTTKGPKGYGWARKHDCSDGYFFSAPVGNYEANAFGLHDTLGNVLEWTDDCWNGSYNDPPGEGSAWTSGDCSGRVLRGGSWPFRPSGLRSAHRGGVATGYRNSSLGFRLARTLS